MFEHFSILNKMTSVLQNLDPVYAIKNFASDISSNLKLVQHSNCNNGQGNCYYPQRNSPRS